MTQLEYFAIGFGLMLFINLVLFIRYKVYGLTVKIHHDDKDERDYAIVNTITTWFAWPYTLFVMFFIGIAYVISKNPKPYKHE